MRLSPNESVTLDSDLDLISDPRPRLHFQTMTSHSYEVALYGKFLKGDLKPVLNRIALHSESAHQIHSREVIFDPPDAAQQREANQEPALLRALKELLEPDAKW
jgi:mediator of RNA polymerase II transcription subunit 18